MPRQVTFSRAILYSDASGVETGVEYDPTYRLGRDNDVSYAQITACGGDVQVRVDHIPALIEMLQGAAAADEAYRAAQVQP